MHMRDAIDEEVKKLREDMERKCDMSAVLNMPTTLSLRHCAMSANYTEERQNSRRFDLRCFQQNSHGVQNSTAPLFNLFHILSLTPRALIRRPA